QINRPQFTLLALYEYGNLLLHQQQIENAESTFREMLNEVLAGSQELFALAQYGLARVEALKGNLLEAQRLGEASVVTLETLNFRNAREVRDWFDTLISRISKNDRRE
nr:hypothetical protein [Ktedonobacteraceae bacterium]